MTDVAPRGFRAPLLAALLLALSFLCSACVPIVAGAAAGHAAGKVAAGDGASAAEECLVAHPDWSRLVCTYLGWGRAAVGMTAEQLAAIPRPVRDRAQRGDVERLYFDVNMNWAVDLKDGRVVACKGPQSFCAPPLPESERRK